MDADGVIYKYIFSRNNFIKLTHWSMGEKRTVSIDDLSRKELKELKQTKACELTNKYWNNLTREWEYQGKKYKVLSKEDRRPYYQNAKHKVHIFGDQKFWIGLHQNRIVWYFIRPEGCMILKFHSINKEPSILSDLIGYVSEEGIMLILDYETNEFI